MSKQELADGLLIAEKHDGIARLTLNHPQRHNAMRLAMWQGVPGAISDFESDPDMRVVVLSGAGGRAFCAGADISEFGDNRSSIEDVHHYDHQAHLAIDSLLNCRMPVIAAVDGVCIGGGMELAMACDIVIASEQSRFGVTPSRLGLGYSLKDTQILVGAVGSRGAMELLLTGKIHSAPDAHRLGLINHVYPAGEYADVVEDYATTIAANAPIAVSSCKAIVRQIASGNVDEAACNALVDACFSSEDYKEGQRAFAEKRKPNFRGV